MKNRTKNQVNKPGSSNLRKIYFKNKSGSSMLCFKDLTPEDAYTRKEFLKRVYNNWRGEFIVTR